MTFMNPACWRGIVQRRDQKHRKKRKQSSGHSNASKSEARVEGASNRRADREGCEHGAARQCDGLAGIANGEDRERPALPADDDEAFAHTQKQSSEKKNGHRDGGSA
jgi:hypothetical protein